MGEHSHPTYIGIIDNTIFTETSAFVRGQSGYDSVISGQIDYMTALAVIRQNFYPTELLSDRT